MLMKEIRLVLGYSTSDCDFQQKKSSLIIFVSEDIHTWNFGI